VTWLLVAAIAIVFLVGTLVALQIWRGQQRLVRRVLEVTERLGDTPPTIRPSSQTAIDRLERSVDRVRRHDDDARLSEVRLERAMSEMTEGAIICDANGRVVFRNSYASAFAEARHGNALVEAAIDELLQAARQGLRGDREIDLHGPPRRVLFINAAPLYDHGELIGAIAVVDDITDQQRIDAMRRDFVANVSHELKTPVGALALLAETLADETDPGVVRRLSERMRDEAFRVGRMIDDLLVLSRIESGDSLVVEQVAVSVILDEAVDRVRPVADHRGVAVQLLDVDPGTVIVADRRQLTSAVFNVLENAVKYSERGSSVQVRVVEDGGDVSIVVQDHGIGIPTRDLERIFERFYRVDKARSRETGGTGLGLAIVRHILRNHGGEVQVVSREGEGSTFTLLVPRRHEVPA
jgi:two-component system sensor histidine kinase SenX3